MIDLMQVMTFSEAAKRWGFADGNTLRKAVERKRFRDCEIRKSGDVWLTTYDAMLRVFGPPRLEDHTISYEDIERIVSNALINQMDVEAEINALFQKLNKAVKQGKSFSIIQNIKGETHVLQRIDKPEDLNMIRHRLANYFRSIAVYRENDE